MLHATGSHRQGLVRIGRGRGLVVWPAHADSVVIKTPMRCTFLWTCSYCDGVLSCQMQSDADGNGEGLRAEDDVIVLEGDGTVPRRCKYVFSSRERLKKFH